jgi:acyl-CoA thioester hydrolase
MLDITYRGMVYPWQCDFVGHMNVMWYVGKFDEGTWNLLGSIGLTPAYMREKARAMAAVQQNISYRRELVAGDAVDVVTRVLEIRDRVIRFEHEMRKRETGEIAATCELTAVHLDSEKRRACPFPEAIRAAAETKMRASAQT